ncbi:DUF2336 domain-containing protein [Rhizobium sp. XQZ8]|uniref:DUF2336 domain-containing protein n=1 Tax=Rhizobium populisoli TaxID=2859785 RepID=UPI001CA5712D|nr:DUF2336 domain-containing protein [Rhizobium populisoli]MBW6424757.1 DUF2336 domain-containing protein [Rhizobium populisoli]
MDRNPVKTGDVVSGPSVIVEAFLRWAETARVTDRAKAANALARAFLHSGMDGEQQRAASLAMTYLLDDPSPRVRLALAEGLADANEAPRAVIVSLAEDQPEIACTVIARSPVLTEGDLVDLAGRSDGLTRGLIASRPHLSRGVAAAIAEIGDEAEICILLENVDASITRISLRRIAERFGHCCEVRNLLLERDSLPADARHMLVSHITAALTNSGLVRTTMAASRIDHLTREARETAAVTIAGTVAQDEIPGLVDHLRTDGRLTPAFLIHALCTGKVDFFAGAMMSLSGLDDRRVRSILATGRMHAVRALFEASGLGRDIAAVFVEAVFLWRKASAAGTLDSISALLLERFSPEMTRDGAVSELLDMVEKLHRLEMRVSARSYASDVSLAA